MPRRTIVFAALLVACLAPATIVSAQQRGSRLTGIVTHIADGDTLDVTAGARTFTVRLDGIDAPEGGQAFSQQARQHLRVLAFSQSATVMVQTTDRYGRSVARVMVGGRDLSEEMLRAGLAWHFVRYSSDRRLQTLEQEARQRRIGLWADRAAVPPWQYRSDRAARPRPPGAPSPPAHSSAGPFHGNASSRVYHAPGCRDYNCRNCTHLLASRQAAEAAGFRPHAECVLGRK
ncbi:MAG: thermonuclease family protein [Acidobacteria bacterium]|nr:MAG: thermonuclease family protein [Acidobacteriota bacterium]